MIVELDPRDEILSLDYEIDLRAPGLSGSVEVFPPRAFAGRLRVEGEQPVTSELEAALSRQGIEFLESVELIGTANEEVGEGLRLGALGEATLEVDIPAPVDGFGQFVLLVDEAGVISWCFAESRNPESSQLRGVSKRTYKIPSSFPSYAEGETVQTRGLSRIVGKKLIQILIFPLADAALGIVGVDFARLVEKYKFPYRIRSITPDNYQTSEAPDLKADDWNRLSEGRALLLVHGTFSRTHMAFGGLALKTVAELHRRYGGRVFAFDHHTLSDDPVKNVEYFVSQIPDGLKLDLDILSHSRGGLVSRVLAERQSELELGSRQINVHRIVFVGVPNAGTVLTDGDYLGEFLNFYTNLLNFFPDNGLTETLEVLITIAKMLAVGAMNGLAGLKSMQPGGAFLQKLNSSPKVQCDYFALTADFEPTEALEWPRNYLTDRFFKGVANDLVVPTAGVYDVEHCNGFPIGAHRLFTFDNTAGVQHTTFFQSNETQERLLEWLRGSLEVTATNDPALASLA